jgi:hypothetical protein
MANQTPPTRAHAIEFRIGIHRVAASKRHTLPPLKSNQIVPSQGAAFAREPKKKGTCHLGFAADRNPHCSLTSL